MICVLSVKRKFQLSDTKFFINDFNGKIESDFIVNSDYQLIGCGTQ
jgi:hypothetical protein